MPKVAKGGVRATKLSGVARRSSANQPADRETTALLTGAVKRHVRQKSAKACGQCCVAMLLDLPDDHDLPRRMLTHHDMRDLLNRRGSPLRGLRTKRRGTTFCLQFIRYRGGSPRHWVIRNGDVILDPLMSGPIALTRWEKRAAVRFYEAKVTSYIPLEAR